MSEVIDEKVKVKTADNSAIQSIAALQKAVIADGGVLDTDKKPVASTDKKSDVSMSFDDALSMTFKVMGGVLSNKYGEHWAFEDDESEMLGKAWGAYLDSVLKVDESPLTMALSVSVLTLAPRAAITIVQSGESGGDNNGSEPEKPTE